MKESRDSQAETYKSTTNYVKSGQKKQNTKS